MVESLGTASAPNVIGARAAVPNPVLAPLAFLIGEWETQGTHPMRPGQTLSGRTSFRWTEGGAFLTMRQEVDDPDFPDGVAIVGSDHSAGSFGMLYFDERGTSRRMEVEVGERAIAWRHEDAKFAQKLTLSAEGDDRLVSKGLMSEYGGPWKDDLSQVFTRF